MLKAKVFISCGQKTQEEKETGRKLVSYFEKNGFDAYFAEDIHSSLGLTQSIYNNLRTCEYVVCVNFARTGTEYGSLFVQQELAIASYLKLPLLSFHQSSIKLDGVAKYLHVNSMEFKTFQEIISKLDVLTKDWETQSKNQFSLSFGNEHLDIKMQEQSGSMYHIVSSNWYHILVENLSNLFTAKNCYAFIESIYDVSNKKEIFGKMNIKMNLFGLVLEE